ncbi:radical SAM protein [Adlercreutzia equolifaciens]|uniref:radical SAM protein n=1 Tax=Adlercreutzia equolifaciens TaxID=446660 RepID=UPI0023AED0BA|nr:radical SAM protein [Adlercreutzia equolifaciens]MDE8702011.1 radical SAM protein [Adlercreutzia equolifaciens]
MHFASGIVRPPFEAGCEFLQITSGCSHNKCKFCTFYKDAKFAISDMNEVAADLDELAHSPWRHYNRVWLQGADSFVAPYDRLMEVAELIYEKLPWVTSIGAFARVTNFRNKTVSQLERLRDAGYSRLTVGVETGDDFLLRRMNKGYDSAFALEQMSKVDAAGLTWVGQFINGLGGADYGDANALESARLYNQLRPMLIYTASLTLFQDTPLYQDVQAGTFSEASETERLEELQTLISALDCPTEIRCEHVSMPVKLAGRLPHDKERLVAELEAAKASAADGTLACYRRSIVSL